MGTRNSPGWIWGGPYLTCEPSAPELIILGHKTIEVQSQPTNIRERVHIYAGRNRIEAEDEARIATQFGIDVDGLPRGVLVGTVEIVGCHQPAGAFLSRASLRGKC